MPLLPGISSGNVDGRQGRVERKGKGLLVAGLTVREPGELLGVAEDKLQLEPRPVDVEDVSGRDRQVCREEDLPGLGLLVRVKVVNDDNSYFTAKTHRPGFCSVQLVDKFVIHRVLFLEDVHVKVLEINLPGELLGTSSLPGLWPTIEILQVDIIAKTTYDVEAQVLDTADKALFGEISVCYNEIANGQ